MSVVGSINPTRLNSSGAEYDESMFSGIEQYFSSSIFAMPRSPSTKWPWLFK